MNRTDEMLSEIQKDRREKALAKRKAYRMEHHDEIVAYMKRYREENREKFLEYQRRYSQAHKREHSARVNACRASNRAKFAEKQSALRLARIELGLRQIDVANLLGVSQPTVSCWEHGCTFCDVDYAIKKLRKAVGV